MLVIENNQIIGASNTRLAVLGGTYTDPAQLEAFLKQRANTV